MGLSIFFISMFATSICMYLAMKYLRDDDKTIIDTFIAAMILIMYSFSLSILSAIFFVFKEMLMSNEIIREELSKMSLPIKFEYMKQIIQFVYIGLWLSGSYLCYILINYASKNKG